MSEKKEIRICDRHEKQVPLIWTFAFPGSEFWCPYCGGNWGMLGAGEMVPATMELKREAVKWKNKSKEYLSAKCKTVCDKLKWKGEWITYDELPEKEKERIEKVVSEWKYEGDTNE